MATTNQSRGMKPNTSSNRTYNHASSRSNQTGHDVKNSTHSGQSKQMQQKESMSNPRRNEILVFVYLAVCVFLLCSSFGWCGVVGNFISKILFGLTGSIAYLLPVYLFLSAAFLLSNGAQKPIVKRVLCVGIFLLVIAFICQLVNGVDAMTIKSLYQNGANHKRGGGVILGGILVLLHKLIGFIGCIIVTVLLTIIGVIIVVDVSLIGMVKHKMNYSREEKEQAYKETANYSEEHSKQNKNMLDNIRVLESGGTNKKEKRKSKNQKVASEEVHELKPLPHADIFEDGIFDNTSDTAFADMSFPEVASEEFEEIPVAEPKRKHKKTKESTSEMIAERDEIADMLSKQDVSVATKPEKTFEVTDEESGDVIPKEYIFPPLSLLKTAKTKQSSGDASVRETAMKLKRTLENFGVNVSITNYSCGPSVTRYELQPEQGVKVSKIVNLADDIKLNLAAADIRIEAPIPGKAAIGIEVPNKESQAVYFRDLLESDTFQKYPSNIAFAVGKDISGQVIVADIAKMPHLLVAGATGSGKSVCINTLIMSIIYKANPNDVKLIMVDPKQVELSIYNGIPHMLIPVVTDPKKAAGALNWAVLEMTNRYQLFAQYNVRNLQGYNEKVKQVTGCEEGNEELKKLPQIIIIVDELADLMMVAHGEVEDAIVRLSQLARAAGIHLVIATQRPSVDVITGLIKANVPSRIAMTVSSGVDSRTILDMNGAEKLLGKGDMLFYPTGYPKPVRVQGAFLSDDEIAGVVDFLKKQNGEGTYDNRVIEELDSSKVVGNSSGAKSAPESEYDDYFVDAGKFIIGKDKASIGMLQRVYKIGFNRAARIMDQLSDAGVVGPEEGTKPRKVLMSMEEFENYVEENL
ncbi:MAG: DNA translocase FtsK 4TM domain-containing protein [Eubacteriales bacterium]|nr:DNA translocase FtsK 4TM domain-containing protein [Eubacteriales bacterium]